jgi:alpha-glucuronidase
MAIILTLLFTIMHSRTTFVTEEPEGLVGRWGFDDGTGKDLSGNGNDAVLEGGTVYSLGEGQACVQFMPEVDPMRIPASEDSALAISSGTICFWLNTVTDRNTLLKYDNRAVEINAYRGDFQVRFGGEDDFRYWDLVLDYDWPKYDMREFAFYGHPRASIGDSQWHLFAVAYDVKGKKIIGWRDGELISVIDLSTVDIEPLRRKGLTQISTGEGFIGFMDDLRIYNRVLTDAEIREIYNSTKSVYAGRRDTIPTDKVVNTYKYRKEDQTLYRAWLQYRRPSSRLNENLLKRIVAEGANSTIRTAAVELSDAVKSMFGFKPSIGTKSISGSKVVLGTAETSTWIRDRADKLNLDRIKNDGFIIKTIQDASDTILVIAGKLPAGVIFGTFDLIRRIQLGHDPGKLDVLENPQIPLRMVDHWSYFRGYFGDKWRGGGRNDSIYSWEELRTGDTKLIRDWVRLMASSGWNAICPSEINWSYRNNFLEHLDEVEILAGICRDYGITLYWCPSYLLALEKETADKLYSRVPDFGGYLLKLGSEKQNGDPRPRMVNRIADNLRPYGGHALVRAFVYGNYRYTREPYRNLIPYDIFAPEDGNYRDNVILISKGSPLDWDFAAPIPALDGAIKKNLYGSEMVIAKSWPVSWIEKWKWWMEQDNYRNGPGSLNKFDVDCIMGVSMISPSPAWTECPLNMVNYYGMGRLAWNPDLSVDQIYTEWIRLTFGDDPDLLNNIKEILLLSDDVTRKLYMYRGYRGIWIDTGEDNLVQGKTPHTVSRKGIGVTSPELRKRLLDQYAPGLREIYGDRIKGEEFLPYFHFVDYGCRLSNGRTVIQDIYANLDEAVKGAEKMPRIWKRLNGKIDQHRFQYTLDNLTGYIEKARKTRNKMVEGFEEKTGRRPAECFPAVTTPKP